MASLLSSDISLAESKKAKRTVHALPAHLGSSPDPKKTYAGFSLSPIMVSTKDSMVPTPKSPHAKKAKAHKGKHDRHKHSSHHQKHAKAHRDIGSTEKDTCPKVGSDLLTLRGCALSALSKSTAAGRTQLQEPQQQEPQQQQQQQPEWPVVSAAEGQPPTIATGQLHPQQQGNWQTAVAKGPYQASPCAGAAPNNPETCQKTLGLLAPEHSALAAAHAFPSSLQARSPQAQSPQAQSPQAQSPQAQSPQAQSPQAQSPQAQSPQAQPQLITSTKGYAETSSTPTNAANSDWHVATTAGLFGDKSVLCTTDSPDAGTKPDHDMPDLGIQCITKPWPAIKQVTDAWNCGSSVVHRLAVMHYILA